jgi:hypothetical protein
VGPSSRSGRIDPKSIPVAKDPVNPLVLAQTNPNQLTDPMVKPVATTTIEPTSEGVYAASGYIGTTAVVWMLNPASAVTAAPSEMARSGQRCEAKTFSMDNKDVSGCVSLVDEINIGTVSLQKTEVFFTNQLTGVRAILGSDTLKRIVIKQGDGNSIKLSLPPLFPLKSKTSLKAADVGVLKR